MYVQELANFFNSYEITFKQKTQDGAIKWFLLSEPLE